MATRMHLSGVDELLAELKDLAPDLTAEARTLQEEQTAQTASELRAAYHVVSGELRGSVQVRALQHAGPGVRSEVTVGARHAHFYEFGTARTAPNATFVPITRRGREAYVAAVVARVRDRGLTVGGLL